MTSLAQWFSVYVMCQSGGKSLSLSLGRHLVVVPLYINCIGRNLPDMAQAKTAVICLLSSIPALLVLFFSIVQLVDGTTFIAVWSQLMINLRAHLPFQ